MVILRDRDRHQEIMKEVRAAGARIRLIDDGDVSAAIATAQPETGIDMLLGCGGAPEGVIAAAALRCLGGDMQARLVFQNETEIARGKKMRITDVNRVYKLQRNRQR